MPQSQMHVRRMQCNLANTVLKLQSCEIRIFTRLGGQDIGQKADKIIDVWSHAMFDTSVKTFKCLERQ